MKNTHILIFEHDILKYPPILSVITFLLSQNKKVVILGYCSDIDFVEKLKAKGCIFYSVIENNVNDTVLQKLWKYLLFKKRVFKWLKTFNKENSKVWLFGEQCIWLLHKVVYKYDSNAYLFEIPSFSVNLKYKILSLSLNYQHALQEASKVVCCEYNRAHITKSFFQLKELPLIIPNKPSYDSIAIKEDLIDERLEMCKNKKIILYQGVFNYPERKLDEFCEAIGLLPEEYVLVLMGSENDYKNRLKKLYSSNKVFFMDYVSAPQHLKITELAYIGILVYNGEGRNIENTLNTLYCAPNKIFEYSKFGIPMISNDIPALNYIYEHYGCGEICDYDRKSIADMIIRIDQEYVIYSKNSTKLYDSVSLDKLYNSLV